MDLTEKKVVISFCTFYIWIWHLCFNVPKMYLWDIQCNSAYSKLWPSVKKHHLA